MENEKIIVPLAAQKKFRGDSVLNEGAELGQDIPTVKRVNGQDIMIHPDGTPEFLPDVREYASKSLYPEGRPLRPIVKKAAAILTTLLIMGASLYGTTKMWEQASESFSSIVGGQSWGSEQWRADRDADTRGMGFVIGGAAVGVTGSAAGIAAGVAVHKKLDEVELMEK
ncbi:MAG: hypothetical protein FWE31_04105 [Firmicutes bacterium]|nr:hypothetical protein [Bacillota bacterium]